jgi:hypothetical protein
VQLLYAIVDQIGPLKHDRDVRSELIMIFEKYEDADLGSPGPIVHLLEESPIEDHVRLLADSIQRKPTPMTVWMAERCFRSDLSEALRITLLESLRAAELNSHSKEITSSIRSTLEEYGT